MCGVRETMRGNVHVGVNTPVIIANWETRLPKRKVNILIIWALCGIRGFSPTGDAITVYT